MKEIFESRRSVNFFDKNRSLDNNILKEIINLAVLAPSAFNLQPWGIIAVKSDEAKQRLFEQASRQDKILEAPVTLIIVGNYDGSSINNPVWKEIEKASGPEATKTYQGMARNLYGSTELRKIKFAESNAGLLGMSIMYAAKTLGVDSHPMSGIDFDGIKKEFSLREESEVVMLIALGYHDKSKQLYPRAYRKYYDDVVTEV